MRAFSHSFNGGELTPEFFGQISDSKFQTGLALCRNFRVLPHGPVQNRAGFEFVAEVKDSTQIARLFPFEYSTTQTMVLEMGNQYIRYHTMGETLLNGAVPYETVTTYAAADLFGIKYVQSSDVFTLVHTSYTPNELRRLGAVNWTIGAIVFATTLVPPTGIGATATIPPTHGTATTQTYAVTSVASNNLDESLVSATASCDNNLFDTGAFNTITWTAAAGVTLYNVYRLSNGLYGYIGQASGTSFVDDNITPDLGNTAPNGSNPFVGAGNYPGAVTYYEQRRVFGGTLNAPQNLWFTRSGTESNMSYSIPTRDADSIEFRVAARQANTVRHLVPLTNLVALTSSAEWRITSNNSDVLTPTSVDVKPQSYIGTDVAQPVIVNNNIIFAAARGGHLREMAYNLQVSGYFTGDLSLRAPHLVDGYEIVDMAFSKSPYPIIWMVSSSGLLLGLTYVPEQQIGAWHRHDSAGGIFESIAVVAEGAEDVLYAVINRQIGGVQRRYVERMRPRMFTDPTDAFFVDSGATFIFENTPGTVISGITWLEGQTLNVLADGAVHRQLVVTDGTITLDNPATKVQFGLPIIADIQTLPLALNVPGFGQGMKKNINKVFAYVSQSGSFRSGPDFNTLTESKIRTTEPYGSAPSMQTGEIEVVNKAAWTNDGQTCIRQQDPLPLTIVSMTLDVALGG